MTKASQAALAFTGGGTITATEAGDEESFYQVEVTKADGSQVDVQLDSNFLVGRQQDRPCGRRQRARRRRQLAMHATGRRLVTLTICTPIVSALRVACSGNPAPVATDCIKVVKESGERTNDCLPVAPDTERVDLGTPKFSHPTPITNPPHPTSRVEQVIFGGHVDNKPFRTEVTLCRRRSRRPIAARRSARRSSSTSRTWTAGSKRWPSTGTRRPTTGRCGTSVRTIPLSRTARSATPKEPGWSMTRRRPR